MGQADISGVSVRSALFALKKAGLVSEAEFRALDKGWKKHRAANRLDAHGRRVGEAASDGDDKHSDCR